MSSNSIKQIQETTPLLTNGHVLSDGSNGLYDSEAIANKSCCAQVSIKCLVDPPLAQAINCGIIKIIF
jgi:hypothetical protein